MQRREFLAMSTAAAVGLAAGRAASAQDGAAGPGGETDR